MNGTCSQCRHYAEVYNVRVFGLGLRHFCAECIRWAHETGMDLELVPDADQRRPVEGRREVWPAKVRRILTGKGVAA